MLKKITSLFAMLLLCVAGAVAQILPELEGQSVTVGPAVGEFEPNTWYFLLTTADGTGGKNGYDPYEHPAVGEYPSHGGFLYDQGAGQQINKSKLNDVPDKTPTSHSGKYMVRFIPVDGKDDAYIMQFGTGRYAAPYPGVGNSVPALFSTDNIYDAQEFNIYTIVYINEEQGINEPLPGHFGICEYYMQKCLNQNGKDAHVCWYQSGEVHDANSNSHWAFFSVEWSETNEMEAAMAELIEAVGKYYDYYDKFEVGNIPGQYDADAVKAFQDALDAAYAADAGGDFTPEELRAMAQAIIDTYNTVVASKVEFRPTEGYYYIVSAREWTNEIVIEPEEEDGETIVDITHPTKAIYADGQYVSWKNIDEKDCTFLWKLRTKDNGNVVVQSAANKRYWGPTADGIHLEFVDKETAMVIKPHSVNEDGNVVFAMIPEGQSKTAEYIHAKGHDGGKGVEGTIVGWKETEKSGWCVNSEWYILQIPDEEAAEIIASYIAPDQTEELMRQEWQEMRADGAQKLQQSKDNQVVLGEALITKASLLSSPYSDYKEGTKIENLIDGKANTYWHSDYHNKSPEGLHYLQVEMPSGKDVPTAAFQFTRRSTTNDHITGWAVFGTNDADALTDDCELLAEISTPLGSNTETLTSPLFPTNDYAYLRFAITQTRGENPDFYDRGYGHIAEFQLYSAESYNYEPSQYDILGEIATRLQDVLDEQTDVNPMELTAAQYLALKEAYDAFIARYVNPLPLRDKMKEVAPFVEWKKIGSNPGEWSDDSSFAALSQTLEAAEAYDLSSTYTAAQSEAFVAQLDAAAAAITASANQIRTDKWYTFQMGSEDVYAEHPKWDAANLTENETNEGLFDKYLSVATLKTLDEGYYIEQDDADQYAIGANIHFQAKSYITDEALAQWRFIAVGDSAYMVQNKATGLFLQSPSGKNGEFMTLSASPSLINVQPLGYGFCLMPVTDLQGQHKNYMHAAKQNNVLCVYSATKAGTNSAMLIAEAADVESDYAGTAMPVSLTFNAITTGCYPVSVQSDNDDAVLYTATLDGAKVTLSPLPGNKAVAGQPFILIYGNADDYQEAENEESASDIVKLSHGYDLVSEPIQNGTLVGTFGMLQIGAGKIVATANGFEVSKRSDTSLAPNCAYLEPTDAITDFGIQIEFEISDYNAVESFLTTVAQSGNIYTLSGRLVGHGNLNAAKNLPRGIYILNGTKIAIK